MSLDGETMAASKRPVPETDQSASAAFVAKLLLSKTALSAIAQNLAVHAFAKALPDDLANINGPQATAMTERMAAIFNLRPAGKAIIHVESFGDGNTSARRMALVLVNDDMPFLVDSVTQLLAARGLAIHHLIHPIIRTKRAADGSLIRIDDTGHAESLMYIETDRLAARARQLLLADIERALESVKLAVQDWPAMRQAVQNLPAIGEEKQFLDWLAADNMTLLGTATANASGQYEDRLGLFRQNDFALWNGAAPASAGLNILKSDQLSPVHRRVLLDVIRCPLADGGDATITGLFTSASYALSLETVPLLSQKMTYVIESCGYDPQSHAGKALAHVLENFPRDELYQIAPEQLRQFALRMVSLTERPRPALFLRYDVDNRFASLFVYLPRDSYSAQLRVKVGNWLANTLSGELARYSVDFLDDVLARVHYVVAHPTKNADAGALESELNSMVRGWDDDLAIYLNQSIGGVRAARLALTYGRSFSAAYREQFSAEIAAQDVQRLFSLQGKQDRTVGFYRKGGDAAERIRLKIYRLGEIIPLSDVVPVLEHFGLKAIEEYAYMLQGGKLGWIHDFVVDAADGAPIILGDLQERLSLALTAVLKGEQEDDGFNALILRLGLTAAQAEIFRALFRYMRQTGSNYGLDTVRDALLRYTDITLALNDLWEARFNPATVDAERANKADAAIETALGSVSALDDDRILQQYRSVMKATVRTNAYALARTTALAFKIHSKSVPGLPLPVPYMEIWVYSPRVEGIHLRGGKVARGGLRWSDRRDDFRTEVLSLMKAQMVKNAVIVPVGAKGGFYPKQLPNPTDREAWLKEGTESYKIFIRALLSLTDNLDGTTIVPPQDVVRHDDDDPYLVVAADKGTATFSDIANGIAADHGFWLGDAFASGGSVGYDHKKMGITAKGAWISVERHFREMSINVATDSIRIVGVGDMSGDVFGNGLLRSKTVQLVAAFDHRHIFIDPAPDAATSFAERGRLFNLPRSSWDDYNKSLISHGGGVFPRNVKSITLTAEMKTLLDVRFDTLTPTDLIQAVLKAPMDLLWLGGIGSYIKAASESHAQAGDKANDMTRVDAEDLRIKVIGEGANLGVTQKGRIAFALKGGRMNTDFIDNSAGVDCSDNEVNIKILLRMATNSGALTLTERDTLLASMTDDVSDIVLRDNYQQTQALSIAQSHGHEKLTSHVRLMKALESQGGLNRTVEGLPTDRELDERKRLGLGLTRPELAVLLAYAKMTLFEAILKSPVVDDPLLIPDLEMAFPPALRDRYAPLMQQHRLRRELIATKLANALVNRGGLTLAFDLAEETGHGLDDVASSFVAVRELFDLRSLWRLIDSYDYKIDAKVQTAALSDAAKILRLHMADVMRYSDHADMPSPSVGKLKPGIERTNAQVFDLLRPEPKAQIDAYRMHLQSQGTPEDVSRRLVELKALDGCIGVTDLAADLGINDAALAEAYTILGEQLGLDWASGAAEQLSPADPWEQLLLAGTAHDCERLRLDLIRRLTQPEGDPVAVVHRWLAANEAKVVRARALVTEMRTQPPMTTAKLTHLTTQMRQLIGG
jgi:glutamate dehydrogenase